MMQSEIDICISFDDTGSMSSIRRIVREKIKAMVSEIGTLVPTVRIGVIVHNDYCDGKYAVRSLPLTSDLRKVEDFVSEVGYSGGEGPYACYELALNELHKMDWKSENRVAIMIGDEKPHVPGYQTYLRRETDVYQRTGQSFRSSLDYRTELKLCVDKSIKIYPVQCLSNRSANFFYTALEKETGSVKVDLMQFQHVVSYLMAIFHKENNSLETYAESKPEFKSNYNLKSMFDKLLGRTQTVTLSTSDTVWKFQSMDVFGDQSIKQFVENYGIRYKAGKAFYEFNKPETIQAQKEIVLVDKSTDEVVTDTELARQILGIPRVTQKVNPRNIDAMRKYRVFVQSTSYTRKLIGGSQLLYEVDTNK